MPSLRQFLVAALAIVACAGCSCSADPELASVTGTVTFDGEPLIGGTVMFQPASGRPSTGGTDDNGKYTMQYTLDRFGVIPGTCVVSITSVMEDDWGQRVRGEILPKKYHSETELSVQVEANKDNLFDFKLTSK